MAFAQPLPGFHGYAATGHQAETLAVARPTAGYGQQPEVSCAPVPPAGTLFGERLHDVRPYESTPLSIESSQRIAATIRRIEAEEFADAIDAANGEENCSFAKSQNVWHRGTGQKLE